MGSKAFKLSSRMDMHRNGCIAPWNSSRLLRLLIFLALVLIIMPGHAWMDVDDSHSKFDWRVMPRSPGKTTAPGLPMQAELELQCS